MIEGPSLDTINAALAQHGSQRKAARALGIHRSLLVRRLAAAAKQRGRTVDAAQGPTIIVPLPRRKAVAFSCPHFPFADPDAIRWVVGEIADEQPDDVVHLGDGVESSAAARWADAKEIGGTLEEEYRSHGVFLRDVRLAAPNAVRYFLPGNHEDNIMSPGRVDQKLRSLVDWRRRENQPELADHWRIPTQYIYSRAVGRLVLGQVAFAHGYEHNAGSDEMHALHLANEYGLYVGGHTHKPKPVTQVRKGTMPLRYFYANAGCLRDLSPHYVERARKMDWGHGCVVVEYVPITAPRHEQMWTAETRIRCLFDAWAEMNPPKGHS